MQQWGKINANDCKKQMIIFSLDMVDTMARAQAPPWEVGWAGLLLEVVRWHRRLSGCCWGVGGVSSWSRVPSDTRHTTCNKWPCSNHHTQNPGRGRRRSWRKEDWEKSPNIKNVMDKNQRRQSNISLAKHSHWKCIGPASL